MKEETMDNLKAPFEVPGMEERKILSRNMESALHFTDLTSEDVPLFLFPRRRDCLSGHGYDIM